MKDLVELKIPGVQLVVDCPFILFVNVHGD